MLGNPVSGYISPRGTAVPQGTFVVTSTFAEHVASGRGGGIDIGDAKCGSPIIAMGRGRVTAAYRDPNGSLIVRYALLDFPGYEAGLAHMPSLETAVGVTFARGAVLGHIGTSGANACHLHGGMKLNGVEIDWWPLLDQNKATGGDMLPIPGANYVRLGNKKTTLKYAGNFRNERKSGVILKQYASGTVFYPVAYANDGDIPLGSQSGEWFYGILYDDSPAGYVGGWFHSSLINLPLLVDEVVSSGFTQEQLNRAVSDAVSPLNTRIQIMHSKALDIADD